MNFVNFEIKSIEDGWFDLELCSDEMKTIVSASDAWKNDSPRHLLKIICDYLEGNDSMYAIFDDEPGIYVIYIKDNGIYVWFSESIDDDELKIASYGRITKKEIEEMGLIEEELFNASSISVSVFAKTVYRAFEEYFDGKLEEYETNWMTFPRDDFNRLGKLLVL